MTDEFNFFSQDSDDGVDELEIDDSLSASERIKKYSTSELVLHRLHLVRELVEIAEGMPREEINEQQDKTNEEHVDTANNDNDSTKSDNSAGGRRLVIEAMEALVHDQEPIIRQALAEQLPLFSSLFVRENAADDVFAVIFPLIEKLTTDDNAQVRSVAGTILVSVNNIVGIEKSRKHAMEIIKMLASNKQEEEYRIEAAELLEKCAEICSTGPTQQEAFDLIIALAHDQMFRIRKAVVVTIAKCAEIIGKEQATAKLLPLYLELANDEIWGVRKSCAENLVTISKNIVAHNRSENLIPVFEQLVKDSSRWVRNSAFQNLGPFIATFDTKEDAQVLLSYYISMESGADNKYGDSDTVMYCAYSFPGVLLTLGTEQWPKLKIIYMSLVKDLQWKVRQTLSHSLHEVAKVLGTELTESCLLAIFDLFLKDLDQVKVGVIKHLANFLRVLSAEKRKDYVHTIREIQAESVNWRFRKLVAKQLGSIAELYDTQTVSEHLLPISIQLCKDQVAMVRNAADKEVAVLINHLEAKKSELLLGYVAQLQSFANSTSCIERQTYVKICAGIANTINDKIFLKHFYPMLKKLIKDPIPNVRFIVASIFSRQLQEAQWKQQHNEKTESDNNNNNTVAVEAISEKEREQVAGEVAELLRDASRDPDRDVRFFSLSTSTTTTTTTSATTSTTTSTTTTSTTTSATTSTSATDG